MIACWAALTTGGAVREEGEECEARRSLASLPRNKASGSPLAELRRVFLTKTTTLAGFLQRQPRRHQALNPPNVLLIKMVRGKKPDGKPKEGQTISVDVESFVTMRNSVIANLATLQESVQGVSSSYINYTNAVLGENAPGVDVESALSRLGTNPLLRGLGGVRAASPAKSATGDVKPPKKKRAHDPNAPKRPLTPYFLYMQTARPIIALDLGPDVPKGAVSAEGVQRWNAMAAVDKQLWTAAYTENLKLYNARVHSYKAGNQVAKDMTDEDALSYAEVHNIGVGPIEPTADGQLTSEALLDLPSAVHGALDEEDEEEIPVPVKEAPKSKGAKGKPKAKAAAAAIVPAATGSSGAIVPPGQKAAAAAAAAEAEKEKEKEKSPDKKRKRTSTKAASKRDEVVDSIEEEAPAEPAPKASDKKKRAKKS